MICIYHSRDLDGFCSAAIVKKKYPDCELFGYDYGQDFPFEKFEGVDVVMVDVSLPMKDMAKLSQITKSFLWIDHHKGAIEEYHKTAEAFSAIFGTRLLIGIAACELTWKHFFPNSRMPMAVQLLGEYDTWRNDLPLHWEKTILPFQFGMRLRAKKPEDIIYYLTSESAVIGPVIDSGNIVLQYQRSQDERAMKGSFAIEWEGYNVLCLNRGLCNSLTFDSVYTEEAHDILMPFYFNGCEWIYSIYTKKNINCVELAKKYGGGGHMQAAGFQTKTLLKEIQDVQSK